MLLFDRILPIVLLVAAVGALFASVVVVRQQHVAVVERFGRFNRVLRPGLNLLVPVVETAHDVSLMTQDLHLDYDAKTKDNVTIGLEVAIQYRVDQEPCADVRESGIYKSVYTLADPVGQIKDYFADALRSQIPTRDLETVFSEKDAIASAIGEDVKEKMVGYGYAIVTTPMNRIITTANDRVSATNEAEAAKARSVIAAQADAESMKIQGEGIAQQRIAIAEGLARSLSTIQESGLSSNEANMLLMFTQRLGMLEKFAEKGSSTLLIPEDLGSTDVMAQVMAAIEAERRDGGKA